MDNQLTIFDEMYPKYKITKPIRLIEFFAGYGSQALALKYLGVPFEHWKICEWAVKSIQAYKDIHCDRGGWEYACVNYDDIPDYDYAEWLFKKGISQNYNEPMTLEQIKRLGKDKQKEIVANIIITNNLVNIQQVKGKDRLQIGKEVSDTLQTTQKEGVVINPLKNISGKSWQFEQQVYDENGSARTLKASEGSGNIPKVLNNQLRIRKLTPKECFRLMGVKDEDYEKCAKNQSNASLYHLAGDSIVVNVLMAIFKELL